MFKLGETVDKNKVRSLSPVVLAFVGDAVYSLFVRERLAASSDKKTGELSLGGKINSVKYIDAGLSSPKRFFK